jgi:hypothetical protein
MSAMIPLSALFSVFLAGCNSSDPVDLAGDLPPPGPGPVLDPEPAFSAGNGNSVSWSFAEAGVAGSGDWEFLVQESGDPLFAGEVGESGWIPGVSYEFTGLDHGSTHYYRVQARDPQGVKTRWSASQVSVQDAVAPVAVLTELNTEQTSLLFTFDLSATDEISGILEIELWFGLDGGEITLFGAFPPGEITFQATQGGTHEFFPVAIDVAGNRQESGLAPSGTTLVPEPIIITDFLGEEFDITSAVLEYNMSLTYWGFGLGRYTILPIIDPLMIGPGEVGYPRDDSLSKVLAVIYEDDIRAYKMDDMMDREVVDDVVGGVPIAVSF